jgi:hypothetical protein
MTTVSGMDSGSASLRSLSGMTKFPKIYPHPQNLPYNPRQIVQPERHKMDWQVIIDRNRAALLSISTALMASLGLLRGAG